MSSLKLFRRILTQVFHHVPNAAGRKRPRVRGPMVEQLEDRVVPAFVINPTFASNIQTDPNAATIEASINRVIAAYEHTFTDNVTVNITFQEGDGLGASLTFLNVVTYTDYLNAIKANATSADDTTAQATLPAGPNQPIAGTASNTQLRIPTALLRALRLGGDTDIDSTITLNTSITNLDRIGPQDPGKYDLMDVVAHEIDEALSLGSGLDNASNGDPRSRFTIAPADLFRYSAANVRSFDTDIATKAYLSIDGGNTNLAFFNQTAGGDFGDLAGSPPNPAPLIQDAFGTRGVMLNMSVELRRLDVVGYTRVAPTTLNLSPPGAQTANPGVSTAFNLGSINNGNGPFGVTVSWGDNSPNTTFVVNGTGSLGTQNHTYATAGSWTPTISVTDFTNQTGSTNFSVNGGATTTAITGVTSSTTDGTYGVGSTIDIQVNFNEPVTVTGTPKLTLNSGGVALFSGGSGTNTLTFTYTVAAGDSSTHLDYTSASALALDGGTIKDAANNAASLALAVPGTAGSLGNSSNIVINTTSVSTSGPRITGAVFAGASTGTFDHVQVTFSEALAPGNGFLPSDVVSLTDPNGNVITITDVVAVAGSNDTQFDVTFATQSASGTYTLHLGSTIIDAAFNQMDQNQNGINGEFGLAPAGDEFETTGNLTGGGSTDTTGAHITSAAFAGVTTATFDHVEVTFSESLASGDGFIPSDVQGITAPDGSLIDVTSVVAVAGSDDTIFDVTFAPQSAAGTYTIHIGNTIIDPSSNQMDQNQNGINGEFGLAPAGDEFETTGNLTGGGSTDTTGAHITSAAFAGVTTATFDHVEVTFSESLASGDGFIPSDVQGITAPDGSLIDVTDVVPVAGSNDTKFDVTFAAQSAAGTYTIHLGNTMIDPAFNQMDQNQNGINGEADVAPTGDEFIATGTLAASNSTTSFAIGGSDGSVRIFNSQTGALRSTFFPLDTDNSEYQGLVQVAWGDFNNDGVADLAVAAANPVGQAGLDVSKAGKVFVFDGNSLPTGDLIQIHEFTPFENTSGPNGTFGDYVNGLNIATEDVNGDGVVDLIAGTRGGSATAGNLEYGRLIVVTAGDAADGSADTFIGSDSQGLTPFGPAYQKGVVVAAGNLDGVGGAEIAVTRGGPVVSPNPAIQSIKVKVLQLQGTALTELHLAADGSTAFAPFARLTGVAKGINRDGRVAFVDSNGDGKSELVFSALDPLTTPTNEQIRVGVYSINPSATAGAATIVSTGPDAGTYVTGKAVLDHAITHIAATGTQQNLALVTENASPGVVFLAPLTGVLQSGGFDLTVLTGGIVIDSI